MKQESSIKLLYNPSRIPQKEFLRGFIVRQAEFQRIWEDMLDSRSDAIDPHFLITGQRGMGKTSLMLKVAYEVGRDSRLSDWLIPVLLPEEMYGVADLLSFWVTVANALETQYPDKFNGLADEAEKIAAKDAESLAMETIVSRLRKPAQKLVIFIDNFGDLLDRLSEKEIHRLREICSTAKWLRVVAASARVLDHTYSYDKPFFDFFHPIFLRGLDREEAKGLLERLAELEHEGRREEILVTLSNRPDRLETVRRLSGGVPRMLALLYSFVSQNADSRVLADLEGILDQVTAYYKHRVEELPKQQQALLHHVAMAWDAVGAGEIAEVARMESKAVSSNLRHLVENDILERIDTGGKNHLYRIKERFFNIWYLMRMAGTKDLTRIQYLIEFLEKWVGGSQLQNSVEFAGLDYSRSRRPMETRWMAAEDEPPVYGNNIKGGNMMEINPLEGATKHLWENNYLLAQVKSKEYFEQTAPVGVHHGYQAAYVLALLVRHQHHQCLNIFENSQSRLKDVFKPIWYALQKLRGQDGRKQLLRMGPELSETVDEIVDWVLEMRQKYPG